MQKKCLRGVDNFIVNGKEALEALLHLCKCSSQEDVFDLSPLVEATQHHLTMNYVQHVSMQSNDPSHCPVYSLSLIKVTRTLPDTATMTITQELAQSVLFQKKCSQY